MFKYIAILFVVFFASTSHAETLFDDGVCKVVSVGAKVCHTSTYCVWTEDAAGNPLCQLVKSEPVCMYGHTKQICKKGTKDPENHQNDLMSYIHNRSDAPKIEPHKAL